MADEECGVVGVKTASGFGFGDQRDEAVVSDGSGLRPLYPEAPYEWVTHEASVGKDEVALNAGSMWATWTNRTLVEGLSKEGVPVFVSDVKGDLAGLAMAGSPMSPPGWGSPKSH